MQAEHGFLRSARTDFFFISTTDVRDTWLEPTWAVGRVKEAAPATHAN